MSPSCPRSLERLSGSTFVKRGTWDPLTLCPGVPCAPSFAIASSVHLNILLIRVEVYGRKEPCSKP